MKKIIAILTFAAVLALLTGCGEKKGKGEQAAVEAEKAVVAAKFKSYNYTGRTVKIGDQTWMAENFNNEAGGVCYENNPSNCAKYGRLYTWDEAMVACPSGWHLPSVAEWAELEKVVRISETASKKLKTKTDWAYDNGTDEYGFSALPGGGGYSDGSFRDVGYSGYWWSTTESIAINFTARNDEDWHNDFIYTNENDGPTGMMGLYSVRCVKD